jgi:acyl-coenzyme A thioesterase PaaI-like protein
MAAKDGRQYRFQADLDLSSRDEVAFPDRATRIILQRMAARTHLQGDPQLCGTLISSGPGMAEAELATDSRMRVDELGLLHGGFVFDLADYAAMLAVNAPNVVLAAAEARFPKPVRVGDGLVARASRIDENGREHRVRVAVQVRQITVFEGELSCLVPSTHVLQTERQP